MRDMEDGSHEYAIPECYALLPAKPGCLLGRELGWEAATERMLDAGSIGANEWPGPISTAQEAMAWSLYNSVTGMLARPTLRLLDAQMFTSVPRQAAL